MATVNNVVQTTFTANISDFQSKMSQVNSSLKGVESAAQMSGMAKFGTAVSAAGAKVSKAGGKLSMTLTPAMAGLGLAAFAATQKAADLQESITKTEAVFGSSAATIMDWSKTSATALGMSQRQALEAAGTYGNLLQAFGLTREQAVGMSKDITGLAADLASFNNVPMDDALLALRSGLSGETEPLKRFGIALNDQRLKMEAARIGLGEYTGVLPVAVKAQAAYSLIMKDSALAQGDFARTSDGLANQQRILKAEIEDAVAQFGQALMPILLSVVDVIRSKVIPFFQKLGDAFSGMSEGTRKMVVGLGAFLLALGPALLIVGKMTSGIGSLITSLGMLDKALLKTRIASIATFVTNPAFLIIGGIVLLIAGVIGIFKKLYESSEVLRNAVGTAFGAIKDAIGNAVKTIQGALERNRATITVLQNTFKGIGDFIGKNIVPIFQKILVGAIDLAAKAISGIIDFIGSAIRFAVAGINIALRTVESFINSFISAFNGVGKAIEFVTGKAFTPLTKMVLPTLVAQFGSLPPKAKEFRDSMEYAGKAADDAAPKLDEFGEGAGGAGEKVKKAKDETIKLTSAMRNSLRAIVDFNAGSGDLLQTLGGNEISKFAQKLLNAKKITQDLADEFDDLVDVVKNNVSAALDAANDKLREQQALYDGVFNTVRDGVQGSFSLTEAIDASTESTQAVTEALKAQAEAQEKVNEAVRRGDEDAIAAANKDLEEANKQLNAAQKNEKGFLAFLKIGADQAIAFADQIDALRMAGASVALVQEVAKLGAQRGLIAVQELLRGGAAAIATANELIAAVETAANKVAKSSAEQFRGAGRDAAQAYVNALRDVLMPQLEAMLNEIAAMLKRQNVSLGGGGGGGGGAAPTPAPSATIPGIVPGTVVPIILPPEQIFQYEDAPEFFSPRFFATGGVVMKPTLGIVGEAGPEAVIPLSQYGALGGGNSYTINVNVPVSANRAEVGREIVDAIQAYERRNGRVYEPA